MEKAILKKIAAEVWLLFIFVFVGALLLEGILRVYNPFPFRVKGDRIILPANQTWRLINNDIPRLDRVIIHTKNVIGFRGQPPPKDWSDYLTIITIGGSTTECFYLSDDKTWAYHLQQQLSPYYKNLWINNAGLDGQSTVGHIILLNDYIVKLKPRLVLFLLGGNDIGRADEADSYEKATEKNKYVSWKDFLSKNSEVIDLCLNICRSIYGPRPWAHKDMDISAAEHLSLSDEAISQQLMKYKGKKLDGYRQRLLKLIEITRASGIDPVFITQPSLVGEGQDPETHVDLATIKLGDSMNGALNWKILELYNDVTRQVARDQKVFLIDLARRMPKSSLYFYDAIHNNNEGALKIADILSGELRKYLDEKYAHWKTVRDKLTFIFQVSNNSAA